MAASVLKQRAASKLLFLRYSKAFTPRQFCAVATKDEKEAHQTGIPLIIAPHVIKRAFIAHPSSKEIDACSKYQWFTKTKLFEGLPAPLSNVNSYFSDKEYGAVREQFTKSVLQNYGFRKETLKVRRSERRGEQLRMGILQDLMRCCWSFSDRFPHLDDCFLDLEPKIKIHWVRHHNFYQLEQKPAYIIRTKQQAPLFEPGECLCCSSLLATIATWLVWLLEAPDIIPGPEITS